MPKTPRAKLKRGRTKHLLDVRRDEFDRLIEVVNVRAELIDEVRHDLDIQFKRMAQMQGELDEMQRTVQRLADQLKR